MMINNGNPGGCGLPRILEAAINSPQSQNDNVGAIVLKKIINGIIKLSVPRTYETYFTIFVSEFISVISHLLICHFSKP